MDAADYEGVENIRSRLEHEDNLVNHRLSWILTSQAFLLTGYAILLNASAVLRPESFARHHSILMLLIPWIGVITVLVLWFAIVGALITMRDLRASASIQSGCGPDHIHGRQITRWLGLSAPLLIPAVFLFTWLMIILS
jgi:hypothetical protein